MAEIHDIFEWLSSNEERVYPFKEDKTLISDEGFQLPFDLIIDAVALGGTAESVLYLAQVITTDEEIMLFFKVVGEDLVVAEFTIPREAESVRKMFYADPDDLLDNAGLVVPIPGLESSGQATTGSLDPHWILTESPASLDVVVYDPGTFPPLWTAVVPAGARWIGPGPGADAGAPPRPVGLYKYQITLDLTDLDVTTMSLSGKWATDNNAEIYVNGVPTGITTPRWGFTVTRDFSIPPSFFVEGLNTLEVWVTNPVGGLLGSVSPTAFFMFFADPLETLGLTPGSKIPAGTANTVERKLPERFEMKIVAGPSVLTIPSGLDLHFTEDTACLEPSTVAAQPLTVLSLADADDPDTKLTDDVFIGEGWNMCIRLDEKRQILFFDAIPGCGLGPFIDCTPFEEAPRRIRYINGLTANPGSHSFTIEGDRCIEVLNYPDSNMIVLHNHCRPCCDCDRLVDLDTRITALGG